MRKNFRTFGQLRINMRDKRVTPIARLFIALTVLLAVILVIMAIRTDRLQQNAEWYRTILANAGFDCDVAANQCRLYQNHVVTIPSRNVPQMEDQ